MLFPLHYSSSADLFGGEMFAGLLTARFSKSRERLAFESALMKDQYD
jgi:hypothetical protein